MKTVTFTEDFGDQFRMDPEIKDEWLMALRSGEYIQGRSRLKNYEGRYCCLGVLCVIHGRHQEQFVDFTQNADGVWVYSFEHEGQTYTTGVLPGPEVFKWAGIDHATKEGKFLGAKVERDDTDEPLTMITPTVAGLLSTMNDTFEYSFEEIANYIETYL